MNDVKSPSTALSTLTKSQLIQLVVGLPNKTAIWKLRQKKSLNVQRTKPFVRGEADPYRGIEGSGLGLAIVKSLIENHGGELKIGTNPNREFIVTMVFPDK